MEPVLAKFTLIWCMSVFNVLMQGSSFVSTKRTVGTVVGQQWDVREECTSFRDPALGFELRPNSSNSAPLGCECNTLRSFPTLKKLAFSHLVS